LIGKLETLNAEMFSSGLVTFLRNPESESNWFGVNYRQFKSECGSSAHVGSICGNAGRSSQAYCEDAEYCGECGNYDCANGGNPRVVLVNEMASAAPDDARSNYSHAEETGRTFFLLLAAFLVGSIAYALLIRW